MLKKISLVLTLMILSISLVSCINLTENTSPDPCEEENAYDINYKEVKRFRKNHSEALGLCDNTLSLKHRRIIEVALGTLSILWPEVRELLDSEYNKLNKLLYSLEVLENEVIAIVRFKHTNSDLINYQEINKVLNVTRPDNPTRKNHVFLGWSTCNEELKTFDFNTRITSDLNLYAHFEFDYSMAMESMKRYAIRANIRLVRINYNQQTGIREGSTASSGVIFNITKNEENNSRTYWALSNWHTVRGYRRYVSHYIIDYRGIRTDAYSVHELREYDLAVIRFTRYESEEPKLTYVEMEEENALIGERLINMSQPNFQWHSISFGSVITYRTANVQGGVAAGLYIMQHSAITAGGSSGSAILNTELRLIGIHFATQIAVPIYYVHRYLNEHVWNYINQW